MGKVGGKGHGRTCSLQLNVVHKNAHAHAHFAVNWPLESLKAGVTTSNKKMMSQELKNLLINLCLVLKLR